jgi:hypothetical protein
MIRAAESATDGLARAIVDTQTRPRALHVVPHVQGWAVRRARTGRATAVFATKAAAIAHGRKLARTARTHLVVHDGATKAARVAGRRAPARRRREPRR